MERYDHGPKPSAPLDEDYPPPSYDESQRMANAMRSQATASAMRPTETDMRAPPPPYYNTFQASQVPQVPQVSQAPQHPQVSQVSQLPRARQVPSVSQVQRTPEAPQVLYLAKGATLRTTPTGAISIPPPPPGCAPTPAQLAAMQGAPVIVKKKSRSFF